MKYVKTFKACNISEVEEQVNKFIQDSEYELIHAHLVRVFSCSHYEAFIVFKDKIK